MLSCFSFLFQYRSTLSFTEETFAAAKRSLRRIDKVVQSLESVTGVRINELATARTRSADRTSGADSIAALPVRSSAMPVPDSDEQDMFVALCEKCLGDFESAMCDDLNTPRATAALFELVTTAEKRIHAAQCTVPQAAAALDVLSRVNEVYGIIYDVPDGYCRDATVQNDGSADLEEVTALAERRGAFKAQKNFAEADKLRKRISELGYVVTDTPDGYNLSKL